MRDMIQSNFGGIWEWRRKHSVLAAVLGVIFLVGYLPVFWADDADVVVFLIGWTAVIALAVIFIYAVTTTRAARAERQNGAAVSVHNHENERNHQA